MEAIGTRREFVWDGLLIDTARTTAERRVHSPVRREIAMRFDKPWEGDGCNYLNIVYDDQKDLYRLYYNAWEMLSNNGTRHVIYSKLCCLESGDGIHWERPVLRMHEFDGSTENNIVVVPQQFPGNLTLDNFFILRDTNPHPTVPGRFKAVMQYSWRDADGLSRRRLDSLAGDDGLHFERVGTVAEKGYFDSLNTIHWNKACGCYFCYVRSYHTRGQSDRAMNDITDRAAHIERDGSVRDIRVLSSKDFIHWTEPDHLRYNDVADQALYTNCVYPYPGAEHMLVAFPSRYVERPAWTPNFDRLCGAEKRRSRSAISPRYGLTTTDCLFMCSRDGRNWYRYDEAFMRPGPEQPNNWVYGDCFPTVGFIRTPSDVPGADDEITFYAHDNHWMSIPADLVRYTLRQDGFVSLHAGAEEKTIVTKPFTFEGDTLTINFSTSARGYLHIKLCAEDGGQTLSSCELFGDRVNRVVDFDGSVADLAGRAVHMEMTLLDADLYAFQFYRE